MNAKTRFALAVAVLGLLMTGPFLLTVGILWVDLGAEFSFWVRLLGGALHLPGSPGAGRRTCAHRPRCVT